MKNVFLIIFIGLYFSANAQKLITDTDIILKRGIYKNSTEFILNSPSIEIGFKIDSNSKNVNLKSIYNGVTHKTYKLITDNSRSNSIGNVFGFCDGKNAYINFINPMKSYASGLNFNNAVFQKIDVIGRYCIFKAVKKRQHSTNEKPLLNGSFRPNNVQNYLFDVKSRQTLLLNGQELMKVLYDDKSLLLEYQLDNLKEAHFTSYILKYNKKYNKEIEIPKVKFIFFYPKLNKSVNNIKLKVNGLEIVLNKKGYQENLFDYQSKIVINHLNENILSIRPSIINPTYIKYYLKKNELFFKKVDLDIGEYYVSKLEKKLSKK